MDDELTRYFNDHLAGSSGALLLVAEIASRHDEEQAVHFFRELEKEIRADREVLEGLLQKISKKPSMLLKIAGNVGARVGGLKLMWEKVEPGKLGMFEALEMLALGIQGKRLLWETMQGIQDRFPEWNGVDFEELEKTALFQRDEVERWRMSAARRSLVSPERSETFPTPSSYDPD